MRFRVSALGLFASLISPAGALGADLPVQTASPPSYSMTPLSNWSGFYSGAFIAGESGWFSTRQTASANGSGYGFGSGALAGYNFEQNGFVLGAEGDIASNSLSHKFAGRPGLAANEVDAIYELHARARLGVDMGNYLPYLAAGAAVDHLYQYQSAPFDFDGAARDRLGWTIGAGVDAKIVLPILGPSILRAEYLYEYLPNAAYALGGPPARTSLGVNEVRLALITPVGANWRAPAEAGPADWSGAYFGGIGGGAHQTVTTKGLGVTDNFDATGGFAGIYTGHNWMFGQGMLGFDGSTTLGDVQGDGAQPGAPATRYKDYFDADFRGRAGWAFGSFLPFVAAGLGWSDSQQTDTANGNFRGAVSGLSGVVGLGLDYMASDRIALRAEYVHANALTTASTHLDSESCCNQSRSSDGFRIGAAFYMH